MVNWVQVFRKHVLGFVAMCAGLREEAIDVDDAGTVINIWIKHPVVLVPGFCADGIMTWWLQVVALSWSGYDVYVPDLIHFGGSTSSSPDRSAGFQARCLADALQTLGVAKCDVVGLSYGCLVVFEIAAVYPRLVWSVVVSGAGTSYTGATIDAMLGRSDAKTITNLLLPESVERVRSLLSLGMHRKLWIPRCLLKDFLEVMFPNRNERREMLEEMSISEKPSTPVFIETILLLWGEHDKFVVIEDATSIKEELGKKATLRVIREAGHLPQLERPCVYNRCLKEFLSRVDDQHWASK